MGLSPNFKGGDVGHGVRYVARGPMGQVLYTQSSIDRTPGVRRVKLAHPVWMPPYVFRYARVVVRFGHLVLMLKSTCDGKASMFRCLCALAAECAVVHACMYK